VQFGAQGLQAVDCLGVEHIFSLRESETPKQPPS
jgi:hypothetical protein